MERIHDFDFYRLRFGRDGELEDRAAFEEMSRNSGAATDAIFLAHGWRNNEDDASRWYTRFLATFGAHMASPEFAGKLGGRKWMVAGIYWPSKSLPEGPSGEGQAQSLEGDEAAQKAYVRAQLEDLRCEVDDADKPKIDEAIRLLDELKDSTSAQDEFVDNVLSSADGESLDPNEGLEFIRSKPGSEVLDGLSTRRRRRIRTDDEDEGGAMGIPGGAGTVDVAMDGDGTVQGLGSFFGGVFGKAGRLLNMTTWYVMKERAGVVGASGVAQAVRELKKANPAIRVHLVGHSLGGRLMAACAKSLGSGTKVQPDSLTLLQAAFSHYGFSKAKQPRGEGFFRAVVDRGVVKGPIVATFSTLDDVVGRVYAVASMLAGDNVKRFGDKNSQFGGIGANGAQELTETASEPLHTAGKPYGALKPGIVHCLDGSTNLITSHGDITNPNVTYAFASAVAQT